MLAPSTKFTTRWSRNQSRVALFLVLAVPMTIAPVFAARQTLQAGETLVAWVTLLFVFAGIFHFSLFFWYCAMISSVEGVRSCFR